jgi:membrane-associated protein
MGDLFGGIGELSTMLLGLVLGGVLVLDTIPVVGVLIPADVAVLAAVASKGPSGAIPVMLAVIIGTLVGWTLTFAVGRFLSGPLRRSWLGRRIGEARWVGAERLVAGGGGRMVLAAPFLPVFNTIVPIAAGSLRMSYPRFLGYGLTGSALWAAGYVGLGMAAKELGGALFGSSSTLSTLIIGIPGLAIGWVVLAQVRRRMAVEEAATSQPSAEPTAARSSTPLVYPRPRNSIATATATRSGIVTIAPTAADRRNRGPLSGASQNRIMARPVKNSAPMLATACRRSAGVAGSYGGSGHPGEHVTAPDAAPKGAPMIRQRTASRHALRSRFAILCPARASRIVRDCRKREDPGAVPV